MTEDSIEIEKLFEEHSNKGRTTIPELEELFKNMVVKNPKINDVINTSYIGIRNDQYVFSAVGLKDDIRVDIKPNEKRYVDLLAEGDPIDLVITSITNKECLTKGSICALHEKQAHDDIKQLNKNESVLIKVNGINPAGYDVDIVYNNTLISAFMPNTLAGVNKLHNPLSIVGQEFLVMIESYIEQEGTYVVSRRKYLQTLIPKALKELVYDKPYIGSVTGTTNFGVFVEFNECLTGMIHKANIVEEYATKFQSIKPGTKMEFYIKEVIKDKIILTQNFTETLWDVIKEGDVINGKVREVKPFGFLIDLDDSTVGLIHSSELSREHRTLTKGSDIQVVVTGLDKSLRKIHLKGV